MADYMYLCQSGISHQHVKTSRSYHLRKSVSRPSHGLFGPHRSASLTDLDSVGQFISLVALVALKSEGKSDVSIWSSVFPNCFHFPNQVSGELTRVCGNVSNVSKFFKESAQSTSRAVSIFLLKLFGKYGNIGNIFGNHWNSTT